MNLILAICLTAFLGLFYCWTSRINALFFFGRTATPEMQASARAREITREYVLRIAAATVVSCALEWAAVRAGGRSFTPIGILVEAALFFVVFAAANKQARALTAEQPASEPAEAVRSAALLEGPEYWVPGLPAVVAPLACCAAVLAAVVLRAGTGGFASRWNAFGEAVDVHGDAFMLGMACGMIAAGATILLLFPGSIRLRTRMAQCSVRSTFAMLWIGAALLAGALMSVTLGITMSHAFSKGLTFVALAVALGITLWNQSRTRSFVPPAVELGDDDRWRWGLVYVDRADPALFVQSRCGTGYTLNYGRVAAWPISFAILAYVVVTMFVLPHHH